jgi:peptidoglycan hydrolase CwlO-like protein
MKIIKKLVSIILVAVICCSVGFSSVVLDSKIVGASETEEDLRNKIDNKDIKYYVIFDLEKDGKIELKLEGLTDVDYKYLKEDHKDKVYNNYDKAKLAYTLNVAKNSELNNKIEDIQNNPDSTDDQRKLIKSYGYDPISTIGYTELSTKASVAQSEINRLQQLVDTTEGNTPDNVKNINLARQELKDITDEINKYPPTVKQQGEILANLDDDERIAVLDAINKKECQGSYIPFCEFFVGSSADQAIKASFIANINIKEEDYEKYNTELVLNFRQNIDIPLRCQEISDCETEIIDYRIDIQSQINNCLSNLCTPEAKKQLELELEKIEEAEKLYDTAKKYEKKETNWLYSVFDAINNQDQQARSSAKFFGFGADYEDIPNWLAEQGLAASQICLGEIDGYLDDDSAVGGTTIIDSGTLTQYGYELGGDDYGEAGNIGTLDVVYDIRSKRTRTTPDGITDISLSIYLKTPKTENITYMVGFGYKSGDKYFKEILINKTTIQQDTVYTDFFNWDREIKNYEQVHEGSFFIYLKARTGLGQVIANDNTNIYLVTTGEDIDSEVVGNNEGNTQDSTNENVEQTTDTFWDGFDD